MQITYLGHSCVMLAGTKRILIDPFIEGGSVLGLDPDIVAVTHGHSDHLGETVALNKKTVAITEISRVPEVQRSACGEHEYRRNLCC